MTQSILQHIFLTLLTGFHGCYCQARGPFGRLATCQQTSHRGQAEDNGAVH